MNALFAASRHAATVSIREATAADIDAVTAIYRHYVLTHTATFEIDPPDVDEMSRRWQSIVAAGLPYWVAEHDGRVVGYCYVTTYRPRLAYRQTIENSVYVAADCVGLGVGRVLLDKVLALCAASGYREVIAIIGDSANEASIALHRRAGFVHVGVLKNVGLKFGRWLDTVVMQKTLGAADKPIGE